MNVLIKDMEMPANCAECPVNMEVCKRGYKYLLDHQELYDQRADDCPISYVPPHGRLIDADALEDRCSRQARGKWNKSAGTSWAYAYVTFGSDVEYAPTVIPADLPKAEPKRVRCKDCTYYEPSERKDHKEEGWCCFFDSTRKDYDFCSEWEVQDDV